MVVTFNYIADPHTLYRYGYYADYFIEELVADLDRQGIPVWVDQCYGIFNPVGGIPEATPTAAAVRVRPEHQALLEARGMRLQSGPLPRAHPGAGHCGEWVGSAKLRAFRIATRQYPHLFPDDWDRTGWQTDGPYEYVYFPRTGNYLGLVGEEIYVHNGRDWNYQHVGNIRDFVPSFVANPDLVPMLVTFNYGADPNTLRGEHPLRQELEDLITNLDRQGIPVWVDRCYAVAAEVSAASSQPALIAVRVKREHQAALESLGWRPIERALPPRQAGTVCDYAWVGSVKDRVLRRALSDPYRTRFVGPDAPLERPWYAYGTWASYAGLEYVYFPETGSYLGTVYGGIWVQYRGDRYREYVGNIEEYVPTFVPNLPSPLDRD